MVNYDTKMLQCIACLLRKEVSMACPCIACPLQLPLAALKGWTKVLHGTTNHSVHCPGQEKHHAFFSSCILVFVVVLGFFSSVKQNKRKPQISKQKPHQGSGDDRVQLNVILS